MSDNLYIGIDLGGTNVRAGVVTSDGQILGHDCRPTEVQLGEEHSVGRIIECAKAATSSAGLTPSDIRGVGIGSPGPLDSREGLVLSPVNFPTWGTVPLVGILSEAFNGVSGALDNDANVVAYGEKWLGAGRDTNNLLCITLGTGVGGGVVCDGKLLHGFDGNAAEIGHICINVDGPPCKCGSVGCLELYCSATAIVRRTQTAMQIEAPNTSLLADGLTAHKIATASEAGDAFAQRMYEETGYYLGMGIVSATALYNSEVVAIGGGMSRAGELILGPTRRTYRKHGFPSLREKLRIEPMRLGDDAAILGAAKLSMNGSNGS
jgi:glucokinase